MTTSQKTSLLSELESDGPISEQNFEYLAERARNGYYDYIIRKFLAAEAAGLTRADLARRTRISPPRLSRILGAPGNWTIATITRLLAGICAEELKPDSESFLNRPSVNYAQADILANVRTRLSTSDDKTLLYTERKAIRTTDETIDATITGNVTRITPTSTAVSA